MPEKESSSLDTLAEIRDLMQKSSRFISLSGFSGIAAGVFAMLGAGAAYFKMGESWEVPSVSELVSASEIADFILFCLYDAIFVLTGALSTAFFFTYRKTRRMGLSIWDETAKRLLVSLLVPLFTGGVFCAALLYHGVFVLVAPAMLVFYGLSLLNAGKYTLHDIAWLGYAEIGLGLGCTFFTGYGLFFWAMGFGVFHIIYGTMMYLKYDYKKKY